MPNPRAQFVIISFQHIVAEKKDNKCYIDRKRQIVDVSADGFSVDIN